MEKLENTNYDQAKFSLALIDFKQFTEVLFNVDEQLKDANFLMNYLVNRQNKSAELKGAINDIALPTYVKVKQYLEFVEKSVKKYMKDLEKFLNTHEKEREDFFELLNVLIPLIQEKQKFIKQQIKRCFEFSKSQERGNLI